MANTVLHLDFETRSEISLRDVGPVEYARHPSTEVIAVAWAKGENDVSTWHYGEGSLESIRIDLPAGAVIAAHNAAFERAIWNGLLVPRFGFQYLPISRWRCSAARAAHLGLPQSLEGLAEALRLDVVKDSAGRKLMLQMTSPSSVTGSENLFGESGAVYRESRSEFERLAEYCATDVEVERAAMDKMGPMPEAELAVWMLDQKINQAGLAIDRRLCRSAIRIVSDQTRQRCAKLAELTEGTVTKPTQGQRILKWLSAHGVDLDSLAADRVDTALRRTDLLPEVREVLEIRRDTAKSSVAKFARMLQRSESDGRMRDNLRYHGAFTGRWAGAGAQIQNYPRGGNDDIDELAGAFNEGDSDLLSLIFGDPVTCAKNVLRGAIVAPPGRRLLVWDYGQIEARVLAWLAGEAWKVKAFEDIDAGNGVDIYKLAYARSFLKDPLKVTKDERQIGKVEELALGYQGGPGAFVAFAELYFLDIADYYDQLSKQFSDEFGQAAEAYQQRGNRSGIARRTWIAAEAVKICWRAKHPRTTKLWYGLEDAAVRCVQTGERTRYGKIRFLRHGCFLKCVLPSGRALSYFRPRLDDSGFKPQVCYLKTKDGRLLYEKTYGGKLTENVVQAIARDVMVYGMQQLDAAGFRLVATVHDEAVCEESETNVDARLAEGQRLMEMKPKWADGLPLVADGFVAKRYRK